MATGILARRSTDYSNRTRYSMNDSDKNKIKKQLERLRKDAIKANKIVGVSDVFFYDFPDNEMDLVSNLEVTKTIEEEIRKFEPDMVVTHSKNDINVDHRILHNATLTATRPTTNCSVSKVLAFEVPSSTEWNFPSSFSPNIFIDISKELKSKLDAMKMYKSELRAFPHPRSIKALKATALRWGSVSAFNAAEPFYLVRELQREVIDL